MDDAWKPWTTYEDLTLDRLIVVAEILRKVRDDAANDHLPQKGEGQLTLGVGAWERSKFALCEARQQHTWLRVAHGEGKGATHFIFQIGVFGVRFYHGDPNDPPLNYRKLTYEEKGASQGALQLGQLPDGNALRFAVVTGKDNKTTAVHLVEFHEDSQETLRTFAIPLTTADKVTPFVTQKEGVELAPPNVEIVKKHEKKTGEKE
jgi:hypothetical protein